MNLVAGFGNKIASHRTDFTKIHLRNLFYRGGENAGRIKSNAVGLILAAAVIVLRIVLEQAGAPEKLSFFCGVAWLYFVFPILFALSIRSHNAAGPFKSLLKDVLLFRALHARDGHDHLHARIRL